MSYRKDKRVKEEPSELDIRKEELYFLYKYHENYENEPVEKKRHIRYYYENNLRYKGSFYKDRKQFKKYGNPKKWNYSKIKRFRTIGKERDEKYFYGSDKYFSSFTYKSDKVIDLNLEKRCNIVLAYRDEEENVLVVNENGLLDAKEIIREMIQILYQVDNSKGKIKATASDGDKTYNLEQSQVIFKIAVGLYDRWISTKPFDERDILKEAFRELEDYVRKVVLGDNMNISEELERGKYEEYEGSSSGVDDLILIQITARKVSTDYLKMQHKQFWGYTYEPRVLRSRTVIT